MYIITRKIKKRFCPFALQLSIENLTMFPTPDKKMQTTFPIAHSLSYNILKFDRRWSYNNCVINENYTF